MCLVILDYCRHFAVGELGFSLVPMERHSRTDLPSERSVVDPSL
jgi:hypothetical protein